MMLNQSLLLLMSLVAISFSIVDSTFQGDLAQLDFPNIPGSIKTLEWPSFMMVDNHISCKSEGLYQHPDDCKMFYRCTRNLRTNDYSHLTFKCMTGTIFSSEHGSCINGICSQDSSSSAAIKTKYQNDGIIVNHGTPSRYSSNNLWRPNSLSEGRYPDEENCGKFHDCIVNNNGELICTERSCFGYAYDRKLQACIPPHMVEGCYPDSNNISPRHLSVEDPTLQGLCSNSSFQFTCGDCYNLVICTGNTSHTIPCEYGSACITDIKEFSGGVCHPKVPTNCSCEKDDFLKKDLYDPSKYLICSAVAVAPEVQSCPEGFIFNKTRKDCGVSMDPTCSLSGPGTHAAENDCHRYYTCIFTPKGWIQNWFTCPNEKMYNEETQECEDPCEWHYGNFTCKAKGRFPIPFNCSGYYECKEDPSNSTMFIQEDKYCPAGYEWREDVNEGQCWAIGTTREKCVARTIKPSTCSYPTESCRSNALAVCVNEHRYCECEENPETHPLKCHPCPEGHVSNTTGCYPLCSSLTCSDTEICQDGNGLEPGVCSCISGFVREGELCKGTCSNTTCGVDTCSENGTTYNFCKCTDNNGTTAGKCSPCPEGHVSNTTGCYPDCSILTCSDNEFCFDNNGTVPGVCDCVSDHVREGNQCRGTCKHTTCGVQSCFVNGVEHNFCECKDNNGTSIGKCLPCIEGQVSNTTGCFPDCSMLTCEGSNEMCFDDNRKVPGFCQCLPGYVIDGGKCKATCSNLTCRTNENCFDENGMLPAVCKCVTGYNFIGGQCRDTCESAGGHKLDNQCLFFYTDSRTWVGSVMACAAKGQQLASLTAVHQVADYMRTIRITGHHWVGGTDAESEGTWRWLDGRPWSHGYSSNTITNSDSQDCYILNNGYHHNYPCESKYTGYICSTIDDVQPRAARYVTKEGLKTLGLDEKQCPADSFQVGEECFFLPNKSFKTWMDAQAVCSEEGGFLAEPDSITEFYEALSSRSTGYNYWVGGTFSSNDQNWKWSSSKSLIPHSPYFNNDYHNTFIGTEEAKTSCLLLTKGVNLSLYRGKCDDHHLFVCEKNLKIVIF